MTSIGIFVFFFFILDKMVCNTGIYFLNELYEKRDEVFYHLFFLTDIIMDEAITEKQTVIEYRYHDVKGH